MFGSSVVDVPGIGVVDVGITCVGVAGVCVVRTIGVN
jgi:hypothetical protein